MNNIITQTERTYMNNIIQSIICSQFESTFGRSRPDTKATIQTHAGRSATVDTSSDPTHAMQVKFSLSPNYDVEEGYRTLTMLLFGGGSNYIAVYAKLDWNVGDLSTNENEEFVYIKGETPWVCYGYHDSCWRDSVGIILREFHDRIITIDYLFNGSSGWYKNVSLTEEQIAELKAVRDKKYEGTGPWTWTRVSDQEFNFEEKVHAEKSE